MEIVSAVTRIASSAALASERRDEVSRRYLKEDRDDGQCQEGEDDACRRDERRSEERFYDDALGSGRNP